MNHNRCFTYVNYWYLRKVCRHEWKLVVFDMKITVYCGYRNAIERYCR